MRPRVPTRPNVAALDRPSAARPLRRCCAIRPQLAQTITASVPVNLVPAANPPTSPAHIAILTYCRGGFCLATAAAITLNARREKNKLGTSNITCPLSLISNGRIQSSVDATNPRLSERVSLYRRSKSTGAHKAPKHPRQGSPGGQHIGRRMSILNGVPVKRPPELVSGDRSGRWRRTT